MQLLECVAGCEWHESAPYRTISVKDAMADLPHIENGWNKLEMTYDSDPVSHFQRMIRGGKCFTFFNNNCSVLKSVNKISCIMKFSRKMRQPFMCFLGTFKKK